MAPLRRLFAATGPRRLAVRSFCRQVRLTSLHEARRCLFAETGAVRQNVNSRMARRVERYVRCAREKRKGRTGDGRPAPFRLEAGDVRSLQALGAAGDFEFNRLSLIQRLVAVHLDGREVNEDIFAGLALDEPVSLAGIEPLHCSLFSH